MSSNSNPSSATLDARVRVAVDVGGTFTDVVLLRGADKHTLKVLTTPTAPEQAVLGGVEEVLQQANAGWADVDLLILGTTLLLVFGLAPAAIGLAGGLLIQGLFFEPQDIPQYGMNVTTLLVPLFATAVLARRIIPKLADLNISYIEQPINAM
eukprot:gene52656-70396_t